MSPTKNGTVKNNSLFIKNKKNTKVKIRIYARFKTNKSNKKVLKPSKSKKNDKI